MQTASISSSHSHLPILVDFPSADQTESRARSKNRALSRSLGRTPSLLERSFFVILGIGYVALMVTIAQTLFASFH